MTATFTIPGRLPGLNEYTAANRTHPQRGAAMKRAAEALVLDAITAGGVRPVAYRVVVRFEWVEANARRDLDNVAAAKKFILDALVQRGILRNDNRACVAGFVDVFPPPDKENPRIVVTLDAV